MGKKHKHPEHENLERWLVSYADFITLLFATFVVLYALSQVDLAKFKELSVGIQAAFSTKPSQVLKDPGGIMQGTPNAQILPKTGNSILDKISPKEGSGGTQEQQGQIDPVVAAVKTINQEIQKLNQTLNLKGEQSITPTGVKLQERGIVISFASSLFFESGSAGIKPSSFAILDQVAGLLKNSGRIIHVEGHTDNERIATAVYPSNWELSSARASSVVRYFEKRHKFEPSRLAAVGYGETRPIAPNNTADGRAKNRRVDLVILYSSAVKQADAGAAQADEETVEVLLNTQSEGVGTGYKEKGHSAEHDPIELEKPQVIKPIEVKPKVVPKPGHH